MRFLTSLIVVATVCTTAFFDASAQDKPVSKEREALRRVQLQLQQVRQEKVVLEEKMATYEKEKTALSIEKEKLSNQVGGAQARAQSEGAKRLELQKSLELAKQENQGIATERQALLSQKADLEKRLVEMSAKQALTEGQLDQTRAQKLQTEAKLSAREQEVLISEDKNRKLYRYSRELIGQCRDQSASDTFLRLEPFTGIKRVSIENLLEEYRDKIDAQRSSPVELLK